MLDSLQRLLRIQDLDTKIAALDEALAALPERRAAIARELAEARAAEAAAAQLLEGEERDERRLESEMREQEALEERLNAQTAQVQSTQAYEALQHEIQNASEAGSRCETQALELMEAIDEARTQLEAARVGARELEEQEPGRFEEIAGEESALSSERAALVEERGRECEGVEAKLLATYERVARSRRPTVVVLTEKSCPACRIAVPAQRVREIARGDAVHGCSSCQRLLISARVLEQPADAGQ